MPPSGNEIIVLSILLAELLTFCSACANSNGGDGERGVEFPCTDGCNVSCGAGNSAGTDGCNKCDGDGDGDDVGCGCNDCNICACWGDGLV